MRRSCRVLKGPPAITCGSKRLDQMGSIVRGGVKIALGLHRRSRRSSGLFKQHWSGRTPIKARAASPRAAGRRQDRRSRGECDRYGIAAHDIAAATPTIAKSPCRRLISSIAKPSFARVAAIWISVSSSSAGKSGFERALGKTLPPECTPSRSALDDHLGFQRERDRRVFGRRVGMRRGCRQSCPATGSGGAQWTRRVRSSGGVARRPTTSQSVAAASSRQSNDFAVGRIKVEPADMIDVDEHVVSGQRKVQCRHETLSACQDLCVSPCSASNDRACSMVVGAMYLKGAGFTRLGRSSMTRLIVAGSMAHLRNLSSSSGAPAAAGIGRHERDP